MFDCFICAVTPILIFNGDALEAKARWSASLPFRAEVAACPVIEHARCSWKLSRSHPVWKWAMLPADCCSCFVVKTFDFFCIQQINHAISIYLQMRCVIFEFWRCVTRPYCHGCGGQCLVTVGELVLLGLACWHACHSAPHTPPPLCLSSIQQTH